MPECDIGVEILPRLRQSKRRELWAVLVRCTLVFALGLLPTTLCLRKVSAAAGDIDPTFGSGGKKTTIFLGGTTLRRLSQFNQMER